MCGRYTLTVTWSILLELYALGLGEPPFPYAPRYNIAPGQPVIAVIAHQGRRRIGQLDWGLIPAWSREEKPRRWINARSETAADKPSFRVPFRGKRCLIPADGYYEWKQTETGKQPMRIRVRDRELFAMAGLYDTWTAPDGRKLHTCAVLTTEAAGDLREIHDRMPVILRREDEETWLDARTELSRLPPLLKPYPADSMTAYSVSPGIGRVSMDSPACIEPYEPPPKLL